MALNNLGLGFVFTARDLASGAIGNPMTPATLPASPPVVVNLQVDGATLATAVHRADRDTATRSFSPVPAY